MTTRSLEAENAAKKSNAALYKMIGVIGVFFASEVINALSVKADGNDGGSAISFYAKITLELIFLAAFIRKKMPIESVKLLVVSVLLLGTSFLGYILFFRKNPDAALDLVGGWGGKMANQGIFASNTALLFANQCVFIILCFVYLSLEARKISPKKMKYVYICYELIMYFYLASSIVGMLTGIEILRTYPYHPRWGYNGLLPYTNASTGFWLIATFYSMKVLVDAKRTTPLICSLIAMCLAGAKSLWLLSIAITAVFVWKFFPRKTIIIIGCCVAILGGFTIIVSPFWMPILREKISIIEEIYFVIEHNDDMIQVLTSNRLNTSGDSGRLLSVLEVLSTLTPFNFLFGGLGGVVLVEMAFVDIPFAFGIVGTAALVYAYLVMFKRIHVQFRNYFASFYLVTAFLIGWLFNTPSLAPYLAIFLLSAQEKPSMLLMKGEPSVESD